MKHTCFALLSVAAFGLISHPVFADDASQRALAAKLIDMVNGKDAMKAGFEAVINNVIDNMHSQGLPDAGVAEMKTAVAKWYDEQIHFEDIRPQMVDAYIKVFSEADMKAIVDFYNTPVGQKAIKEMPGLMHDGAAIAQAYTKDKIQSLNAALTPILTKYRDQMQAAAPAGGGAPGMPGAADPGAPGAGPAPAGN